MASTKKIRYRSIYLDMYRLPKNKETLESLIRNEAVNMLWGPEAKWHVDHDKPSYDIGCVCAPLKISPDLIFTFHIFTYFENEKELCGEG